MSTAKQIEIYIAMNNGGDYEVADEADRALELLGENFGLAETIRIAKLNVTMAPPTISEASVTVPDDAGETVAAEAAE